MWQKFSEEMRRVIFFAQEEASRRGSNDVGTEHLLLGLVRQSADEPLPILTALNVTKEDLTHELRPFLKDVGDTPGKEMQLTPGAKKALDLAYDEAKNLGENMVDLPHLLAGLAQEGEPSGETLAKLGIDADRILEALKRTRENPDA